MDRRKILSSAGLLATAGATGAALIGLSQTRTKNKSEASSPTTESDTIASPAVVTNKRTLKLVTTWPKNFPGLGMSPERIAERVTAMTDGALSIKVLAAGELVGPFEAYDAVSAGAAEMYHGADYYWQGKSKAFNFFTTVPFGMTARETQAWIYHGGGQELWDELAAKFNIRSFMAGNTGNQMGGWFNKEINSLEDFKGLKMRMPGLGGEVLRRMGASAIALPGGEIYSSLQSGAIDATEWVGPWNDLAFGFHEIAKYYYYPGFHEPGAQIACGINLDVWASLKPSQQLVIKQACAAENDYGSAEYYFQDQRALNALTSEHGIELRVFTDEILSEMGRLSAIVAREAADQDPFTQRVFDSFVAARTSAMEIGSINVEPYFNARRLLAEY